MTDEPDFLKAAKEARSKGVPFEDIILQVYAIGANRGLKIGRNDD